MEITCTDRSRFVRTSDADVWGQYDRLAAMQGRASRGDIDRLQKATGLTLNSRGVLSDAALRLCVGPVSTMTYDWQHTFLSNGVASQEMYQFLGACKGAGIGNIYALLEEFCQADWTFPQQHQGGNAIHKVFNKTRERASQDHWKSGASELLSAYPLVRRFAESIVVVRFPAEMQLQVESLLLCCRVLDLLQDAKGGVGDTAVLHGAVRAHLEKHTQAYGDEEFKPKMHYALHIPEQIDRDGRLYDCFVVERSHQLPKLLASSVKFTGSFERSVVARSLLVRLRDLEDWDERAGLRGRQQACPELAVEAGMGDVQVALQGALCGMVFAAGDLMLTTDHFLFVAAVLQGGSTLGVLGHVCNVVRRHSASAVALRRQRDLSLLWLGGQRVRRAHAWSFLASGEVLALVPDLGR